MTDSTTMPPQTATIDKPVKRLAIVGTAQTWVQTPWDDATLEIASLNDAYVLGFKRVNIWCDLHPTSEMVFTPKGQRAIHPHAAPVGAYLRPEGHLDWLRTCPCPVFMQRAIGGNTQRFPIEDVCAFWQPFWPYRIDPKGLVAEGKEYESSTPALMLMWAVMQGYTEIHIYGIHLATEWEYQQQRPNMEFLIGVAAGLGVKIVLPTKAPICKGTFRYAYEHKADLPVQLVQREMDYLKAEGQLVKKRLAALPWWNVAAKKDAFARLASLDVQLMDVHNQMAKTKARVAA